MAKQVFDVVRINVGTGCARTKKKQLTEWAMKLSTIHQLRSCGFVLLDKLEELDLDTLREFGEWAEQEGLQIIGTRVSTGPECTLYIDDGYSVPKLEAEPASMGAPATSWTAGKF